VSWAISGYSNGRRESAEGGEKHERMHEVSAAGHTHVSLSYVEIFQSRRGKPSPLKPTGLGFEKGSSPSVLRSLSPHTRASSDPIHPSNSTQLAVRAARPGGSHAG